MSSRAPWTLGGVELAVRARGVVENLVSLPDELGPLCRFPEVPSTRDHQEVSPERGVVPEAPLEISAFVQSKRNKVSPFVRNQASRTS